MGKQRILSMDLLKLFAIFLVIYGHCLQHLVSITPIEQPMFRFLHSFHMPLFMAVSGFFAMSLQKLSLKEFFVKKGRQLLVPAIGCCFLAAVILLALGENVEREYYIYGIWFLKSLFLCSLLYYVATRFKRFRMVAFLVSLLLSQIIPYFNLPTMYPPFLLGAVIREFWPWFKKNSGWLMTLSGGVFVIMLLYLDGGDFVSVPTMKAIKGALKGDFSDLTSLASIRYFRIAIGFAGILFFILLFETITGKLSGKDWIDGLGKYGQRTLGVYVIQTFVLEIGLRKVLNFDDINYEIFAFIIAPALSMIVLVVTLWLVSICEKSRFTSALFLGK